MRDALKRSVAVGFFDGVHLGHQAIISRANEVLTFRNHPLSILNPDKAPRLIMTFEERIIAIAKQVTVLEFTRQLADMSAKEFAREFLKCDKVVCGENWRFGHNGEGNAETLKALGYEVEIIPYAEYKGERISSTRIRSAIKAGAISDVNAMLGRSYSIIGTRFLGKGEGKKIGYPTVNLKRGVYKVEANGMKGIANYGRAPTFGKSAWDEDVVEVHFLDFVREEKTFESIDMLKAQIARDVEAIRE